jgi:hypothetical protein
VGGAGDARIVVTDALLATGLQEVLVKVETTGCDLPQILLDHVLVLRSRRHQAGVEDRALGVEPVAVIEDAARRLGAAVADGFARFRRDEGPRRRLLFGDQP